VTKWIFNITAVNRAKTFVLLTILISHNQLFAEGSILAEGSVLYKQACYTCHDSGLVKAPRLGDKAAWAPRLSKEIESLIQTVIRGKGAMPPRGGTQYTDAQIKQIIKFMLSKVK
jgi:cytochrome c5